MDRTSRTALLALNRAVHEHALLVLAQVLGGCDEAAINVLPVKGILTGRLFYSDPGERPIQDVDLRVTAKDLQRIEEVARRRGWRMVHRSRAYETVSFDVLGFLVEFESHVGPPGLCGLAVEDMIGRALRTTHRVGIPHLQPEIHDHALLLCVNAFKDKLIEAQPGAIRDLELVLEQPAFEPPRLIALARATGCASILWIVATWLARERESQGWRDIRSRLGAVAPRPTYSWLFERAIHASPRPHQALRLLARIGADRPRQWVGALRAMAGEGLESLAGRGGKNSRRIRGN